MDIHVRLRMIHAGDRTRVRVIGVAKGLGRHRGVVRGSGRNQREAGLTSSGAVDQVGRRRRTSGLVDGGETGQTRPAATGSGRGRRILVSSAKGLAGKRRVRSSRQIERRKLIARRQRRAINGVLAVPGKVNGVLDMDLGNRR